MSDDAKQKVLIIFGDAAETVDTMYPYFRLIEGGYEPVLAAPEKREYQMVMHQVKPGWTITREWEGYTMPAAIAFKDIQPEEYLGIFYSGGRAPNISARTRTFCESQNISSRKTPRLPVSATGLKFRPGQTVFAGVAWPRYPKPSSTLRSVVVRSWMNLA